MSETKQPPKPEDGKAVPEEKPRPPRHLTLVADTGRLGAAFQGK